MRVTVGDTGVGIPEAIITKIFDPFYTTKATGSGLGLATVFSIIEKHGGHISVSSEVGKGTMFSILLPASAASGSDNPAACVARTGADNGFSHLRFLVMDDEEYIRDMTSVMLESFGCEVAGARDGHEALSMLQEAAQKGVPYHGVLMDLTIPGKMGGREAVRALREKNAAVVAIAVSGYSDDPIIADPCRYGFNGSIAKPFMRETLAKELRRHF